MESRFRNKLGRVIRAPENYLDQALIRDISVSASCEGKIIFEGELGPAVSKDPFLSFSFKNGKKGDKVSITWVDNKDDSRTDETKIR